MRDTKGSGRTTSSTERYKSVHHHPFSVILYTILTALHMVQGVLKAADGSVIFEGTWEKGSGVRPGSVGPIESVSVVQSLE